MTKYIRSLLIGILFLCSSANAAYSPVSVSVLSPVAFPQSDFSITGARLSLLWGKQRDIYGLDVGAIGNITEQRFVGIGVSGIFNNTRGNTTILGLQAAGLANINSNKTNVYGLQATLGVNSNQAVSSVVGLQVGVIANLAPHTNIYGAQLGIYNKAQSVYGFQIGLINAASSLHGIQIGLLNFNSSGPFAVSPVINIGF